MPFNSNRNRSGEFVDLSSFLSPGDSVTLRGQLIAASLKTTSPNKKMKRVGGSDVLNLTCTITSGEHKGKLVCNRVKIGTILGGTNIATVPSQTQEVREDNVCKQLETTVAKLRSLGIKVPDTGEADLELSDAIAFVWGILPKAISSLNATRQNVTIKATKDEEGFVGQDGNRYYQVFYWIRTAAGSNSPEVMLEDGNVVGEII